MNTVTVIIPTYNRAGLLCNAIESVLGQTYGDYELLIVDDGSTDETRSVVGGYADDRIRYLYKENGGVSSARNVGIARAEGGAVAFLDSDDTWEPGYLQTMNDALTRHPDVGVVYTTVNQCYSDGRTDYEHRAEYCRSGWIFEALFLKSFIYVQAAMFRKTCLTGILFDETVNRCDDIDFFLRLSLKAPFLYVPSRLVNRNVLESSVSREGGVGIPSVERIDVYKKAYFELGGSRLVSRESARKRFFHLYKAAAERYLAGDDIITARRLYRSALRYRMFDAACYWGIVQCLIGRSSGSQSVPAAAGRSFEKTDRRRTLPARLGIQR